MSSESKKPIFLQLPSSSNSDRSQLAELGKLSRRDSVLNRPEKVLCKGFVTLVSYLGSDTTVVNSARVSFGKHTQSMRDRDRKLLKYLWLNGHTSPFRHCSLQFRIKAPIFVLRQWMKHQVGCSWNEKSGRYVEFAPEFYIPDNYRIQSKDNKQGSFGSVEDQGGASQSYENLVNSQYYGYRHLLSLGVCREQARMVLPLALYSECYWTCSLQAIMHFIMERTAPSAQFEIREYAKVVHSLSRVLFPETIALLEL